MKVKLIADSGSTKTDWALVSDGSPVFIVHTQGINPIHQDETVVRSVLSTELLPQLGERHVDEVFFYGSGVRSSEEDTMQRILQEMLDARYVEARSDLLGAARSLCGCQEGIACILGTGANSCLYDGTRIVMNTPPLGYILGDEGSGAVLGISLLNALYKGLLPEKMLGEFEEEQGLTLNDVIQRVYRQPMANRFLASLSPFIHSRLEHPAVRNLVIDNFRRFLQRNITPYQRPDLPISAVGSIAYYYSQLLGEAAAMEGYALGRIERSPLEALVRYHSSEKS
ncbi:MAG: ATPase [Prevotella sp.]|nr:ATPase [Prevotella sp.]